MRKRIFKIPNAHSTSLLPNRFKQFTEDNLIVRDTLLYGIHIASTLDYARVSKDERVLATLTSHLRAFDPVA
jgi:hypothetical protein